MAIYKSWDALEQGMKSRCLTAVRDITEQSFEELERNVAHFYDAPEGRYKRTGQFYDSREITAPPQITSKGAAAQIGINTGTSYDPAGRDTEWIYNAAEDDGLIGYGGFWFETEQHIWRAIENTIPYYFN